MIRGRRRSVVSRGRVLRAGIVVARARVGAEASGTRIVARAAVVIRKVAAVRWVPRPLVLVLVRVRIRVRIRVLIWGVWMVAPVLRWVRGSVVVL